MPFAHSQGCRIYYRLEGVAARPLVVLVHSLGADHGMWGPQMPGFLKKFRVLRLDLRGHGASDAPDAEYTVAQLSGDVLAAVDAAGYTRFACCGLSLGGMIGAWLGANAADRVTALVLANTSPRMANPDAMNDRRKLVLAEGMQPIEQAVMERFFSSSTLAAQNPAEESVRAVMSATNPVGYAGCCSAVRDMNHRALLEKIKAPVLVIGSDRDASTPWAGHGDVLVAGIAGARALKLDTAHLSTIEMPEQFTTGVVDFLCESLSLS